MITHMKSMSLRDFPGGPVAKTLSSQCRGPRFDPWSGSQILHTTTKTQSSQINKIKKKKKTVYIRVSLSSVTILAFWLFASCMWLHWVSLAVHGFFVAVSGLSLAVASGSSSLVAVCGPLIVVASLVVGHRLQRGLSSWGAQVQLLQGMWDFTSPTKDRTSAPCSSRLFTPGPPEKFYP